MISKWFGYNAPFIDGGGSILPRQEDERLIKNDLLQLLLTIPGERLMSPDFGVNLRNYTFEQLDQISLDALRDEIKFKIARFEPRVDLKEVEVMGKPNENYVNIVIRGALTNSPARDFLLKLNIPLGKSTTEAAPQQVS